MTTEEILAFCKAHKFEPLSTMSELESLPQLLLPDENVSVMVEGIISGNYRDIAGKGLLITTNKRVIYFRKSFIGKDTYEELQLSEITSVSYEDTVLYGTVTVSAADRSIKIERCNKKLGAKTAETVKKIRDNEYAD